MKRSPVEAGVGRPRRHKYAKGERVPLSLRVRPEIKALIDRASAAAGRSQSAEVEHRLEQSMHTERLLLDAIAFRYGKRLAVGTMIEAIADAAQTVRTLGEALAAGEGLDQDDADLRIYSAIIEAVRLAVAWHDPASTGRILNPQHVDGGRLTWDTLPNHAAWAAYNRASADPDRLLAFKAITEKFDAKQKLKK
jgi:hypothetical protein